MLFAIISDVQSMSCDLVFNYTKIEYDRSHSIGRLPKLKSLKLNIALNFYKRNNLSCLIEILSLL